MTISAFGVAVKDSKDASLSYLAVQGHLDHVEGDLPPARSRTGIRGDVEDERRRKLRFRRAGGHLCLARVLHRDLGRGGAAPVVAHDLASDVRARLQHHGQLLTVTWVEALHGSRREARLPEVEVMQDRLDLDQAREILVLTAGADKAARLKDVLEGPEDPERLPIQLIKPSRADGKITWIMDVAAAGLNADE